MDWLFSIVLLAGAAAGVWLLMGRRGEDADDVPEINDDDEWEWVDADEPTTALRPPRQKVDVLKAAEQKESVEHGLIILRWLRNLQFADKSIEELVETGTPQEKEEAAGGFAKLLEMYQRMMNAAVSQMPHLLQEPSIQEAEKAAKLLQHGIKLLASLEKPISISQSRQISADVSQPATLDQQGKDSLKDLFDRLESAMRTADTALEHAMQEAQTEEREASEAAMESGMADHQKRRRRRRRQQVVAKAKASAQVKLDKNIRADDYALKQGVFAERKKPAMQQPPQPGLEARALSAQALEAVLASGRALAQSGRDASVLTPSGSTSGGGSPGITMSDVKAGDKIAPDDVALSAQEQLRRDREKQQGGPKGMNA